ncbi:MAG TPA: carboxypeptidase regulatory-like domain-containing protein [Bacteroidia bacterium]|nr:carboxypeptidase regulatory-like domain-containing protein [Bacteroidia bacterium]
MKKLIFVLFLATAFTASYANHLPGDDEQLSVKAKAKLELAKQKMYSGKTREALVMFKEILTESPKNGHVLYLAADCSYKLGEVDEAVKYLETGKTVVSVKPQNFYLLGIIYLSDNKVDEALAEFTNYKSKATPSDVKEHDPDVYISQCNNAKKLEANPVQVKIENLGQNVNSKFDDKGPAITADGKKLFFNSRRPLTEDAMKDVEGDGKYFESIYVTNWDSAKQQWAVADEIPGQINQKASHVACTGISSDGKQIFIYKNDMTDAESRGGDIFVSKVSNNKWRTPEPFGKPINTTYWEGGACISPDGKTLYFTSERKGGFGNSDIWMAVRKTKTEWDIPVNLGAEINTPYDEAGLFLAPDGKTLFFCSNGANSMGSYDIFRTICTDGKWSKPENLGYPINTTKRDGPLVLGADSRYAYMSSDRLGGFGENDIYKIDLQDYAILEKGFKKSTANSLSIVKGLVRDGFEGKPIEGAEITFTNDAGEKVSLVTNENGEYLITLKGGTAYQVKVTKDGFKPTEEKINLNLNKTGDTFTIEKQFLLNK